MQAGNRQETPREFNILRRPTSKAHKVLPETAATVPSRQYPTRRVVMAFDIKPAGNRYVLKHIVCQMSCDVSSEESIIMRNVKVRDLLKTIEGTDGS